MELRVLNYFLIAAREENITKAAALLHITQPTLSRQLMQLEAELGGAGPEGLTPGETGIDWSRRSSGGAAASAFRNLVKNAL